MRIRRLSILLGLAALATAASAGNGPYLLELGLQGGTTYYMGDAQKYIFTNPREVYGAQIRYKIDRRWALQLKGQNGRIAFKYPVDGAGFKPKYTEKQTMTNNIISLDVAAEYNFFRYGNDWGTGNIRPYTPYIFLGLGVSLYDGLQPYGNVALYIPFGIGFKWNFAEHCGLILTWQHSMYFVDDLENVDDYNNIERLNGSNFLNCDRTGSITFGLVFDFIEAKKVCRTCDW